ncbi:C-type lectin domain family 9 member A isoform X2 [Triplophysa dalaica]|uniref:C-type lectin domain family 9 member A isoform X2 n=1 Tax=Triplophysa dalaica TaxID=1582913 RepID=UPI0024DF5078|nr:C-type lectin domain family 9 member A isoform X2 [Triplophysa dalaica]
MEDEVCYSTVIFKSSDNDKTKELQSDDSVPYAEVKIQEIQSKSSAQQLPGKESGLPPQDQQSEEKEVTTSTSPSYRRATVCLGVLCILLISALTAVSILNYNHMTDSKKILTLYTEERTDNQQLLTHKELLEREIKGFTTQNEELNSNLNFILKQKNLSIEDYCQSTENGVQCKPCPKIWIQNGSSCYYFHVEHPWKTWGESEESCKTSGAHLAIIDRVEEQEFVNQHVEFYFDVYHGYWIGPWNWTSAAELREGFWIETHTDTTVHCVLSMRSNISDKSWKVAGCSMMNRWICKMTSLTWPQFLNIST